MWTRSTRFEKGNPGDEDDATRLSVLEAAAISRAKTIVLCSQNDAMNLQIALKARSINGNIHVVIRIFDEDFAKSLQEQFGFSALSATGMAAPVFAPQLPGPMSRIPSPWKGSYSAWRD